MKLLSACIGVVLLTGWVVGLAYAGLMAELPNQSHYFNDAVADKRLNPAGPDHAQVAAAGAVLDYVDTLHRHHGGASLANLLQLAKIDDQLCAFFELVDGTGRSFTHGLILPSVTPSREYVILVY